MESLIISRKKLQVIVFRAFSQKLTIGEYLVEAEIVDDFWFRWRACKNNGEPVGPYHEFLRRVRNDRSGEPDPGRHPINSMDYEDIIHALTVEFEAFKKLALWEKSDPK